MSNAATLPSPVLACFRDDEDEKICLPLMKDIPGIVTMRGKFDARLLYVNGLLNGTPRLVILSSRLYPGECPDLVREIKPLYPEAEFLLITPAHDPLPPFQQLVNDKVRHLTVTPLGEAQEGEASLTEVVGKLIGKKRWDITDYVRPGTPVHYFPISSSCQKEQLIASIELLIDRDAEEFELLRQKAALLADEMLENALYGAPRGEDGTKLYQKGADREILADEEIHFRFAFDGKNLAMEIVDGWGTLCPDQVVSYLANNQESAGLLDEAGGRGLFIIWRFLDHFHVSIRPGRQTVLGGHLKVFSQCDPAAPKGFSISTHFH